MTAAKPLLTDGKPTVLCASVHKVPVIQIYEFTVFYRYGLQADSDRNDHNAIPLPQWQNQRLGGETASGSRGDRETFASTVLECLWAAVAPVLRVDGNSEKGLASGVSPVDAVMPTSVPPQESVAAVPEDDP